MFKNNRSAINLKDQTCIFSSKVLQNVGLVISFVLKNIYFAWGNKFDILVCLKNGLQYGQFCIKFSTCSNFFWRWNVSTGGSKFCWKKASQGLPSCRAFFSQILGHFHSWILLIHLSWCVFRPICSYLRLNQVNLQFKEPSLGPRSLTGQTKPRDAPTQRLWQSHSPRVKVHPCVESDLSKTEGSVMVPILTWLIF